MAGDLKPLGPTGKHVQLVSRMAEAAGTDPASAADAGTLSQEAWSEAIRRCRGCNWSSDCARWLNTPARERRPVPARCENQVFLMRLAQDNTNDAPC